MIEKLLASLEALADREAMVGLDTQGEPLWRRSGRDTLREIGGWQQQLRARGVGAGDRVAIDLPRGPDLLPAQAAVLASGATVVPVNTALTTSERRKLLERADLKLALDREDGPGGGAAPVITAPPPGTPALLIFTSGTTGQPKAVPLTLANLEANLDALAETWGLSPADRLLHVLPAHHVHGLCLALYGCARAGLSIVLAPRFESDTALRCLERYAITVFMGVPTMYHRLLTSPAEADLSEMRVFISGSAPLSVADFKGFETRFGYRPLERYGLSETLIVSSNPLEGERRPGSVGLPLPDTELRLAEDAEILVRGPAVMEGYWRAPEALESPFVDGFFRTGDLGRIGADGYLEIYGRKKELILVGGSNVLPGEVEHALAGEREVNELAVAGVADSDLGERVVAFVVADRNAETSGVEARLRVRAESELAAYKRPREYRFLDELPRNAMGKLDRRALAGK